jgi:arylsulfatase A-like enzyme
MLSGSPGGCLDNRCGPIEQPTLADRAREALARRDEDVAVISSWEVIERAAALHPERIVVSAGRHGGATRDRVRLDTETARWLDDGALSSPLPGERDYRPDRYTAALALRYLERARPRFLFIGLGDTDELAHARNYRAYLRALQDVDRFLGALFDQLERMGEDGARTTVIVTTDHGRNAAFDDHGGRWPESGRVFVLLGGQPVTARGKVDAGPGARLGAVFPTALSALGLPP